MPTCIFDDCKIISKLNKYNNNCAISVKNKFQKYQWKI